MKNLALAAFVTISIAACGGGPEPVSTTKPSAGLVAFETVRQVLQDARCQNCHPAGDAPLQGDDSHVHAQNVRRGKDGHGNVGEECTTCHGPANPPSSYGTNIPPGNVKGWHMPTEDTKLVFVGLAPGPLCEQLKDPARNGGKDMAALRTHLDDPLVTWGWSPGFGRKPVAVPREQFISAWETWARAGAPCPTTTTASASGISAR